MSGDEELERRRAADRQRALIDAARALSAREHDLDAMLDALSAQARLLLGADAAPIDLGESPDEMVVRRADRLARPDSPLAVPGYTYSAGGLAREALVTGRPTFARDYATDPRPNPTFKSEQATVASALVVPLVDSIGLVGFLTIQWARPADVSPEDVDVAQTLGAHAAIAIRNARLHEALRRSQKRYRLVAEAASLAVWEWDMGSDQVIWSGAGRALLGGEPGETTAPASWWHERVHPDERESALERTVAALAAGQDQVADELRVRRSDGSYGLMHTRLLRVFRDALGAPVRALGMIQDVTAARAAEAERERLAEELARAQERELVAMDLHDGTLASLSGVLYALGAARNVMTTDTAQAEALLRAAMRDLTATASQLRSYAHGLQEEVVPLREGLERLAGRARATGIDVVLEIDDRAVSRLAPLGGTVTADLLYAVREAVGNALHHADATRIMIQVARVGSEAVQLTIHDDGVGFEPAARRTGDGRGLANMAARAARHGGHLTVESHPGDGAEIRLWLPLPADEEAATDA
jgi:PAS domain S-box-containing protein